MPVSARFRTILAAVSLLGSGWIAVGRAAAQGVGSEPVVQDAALEARAREVASSLRCPVCLGLSIEDSPSQLAQEMKEVIRSRLAQGATPDEVRRYFVERYGEWVLLTPKPAGLNLSLWLLPGLALLAGATLVALVVRKWVHHPDRVSGPG